MFVLTVYVLLFGIALILFPALGSPGLHEISDAFDLYEQETRYH